MPLIYFSKLLHTNELGIDRFWLLTSARKGLRTMLMAGFLIVMRRIVLSPRVGIARSDRTKNFVEPLLSVDRKGPDRMHLGISSNLVNIELKEYSCRFDKAL